MVLAHMYTAVTHPLICLFLGDLLNLVQQLPNSQLHFVQFLLGSNLCIVDSMLTNRDVQMNSLYEQACKDRCKV